MHLTLDEVIRAIDTADNEMIGAEEGTAAEREALRKAYAALCNEHAALTSRFAIEQTAH